eukprot:scaffold3435_cov57-Cylindrotheca_fusiformis.AAC.1
MEGGSNVSSYQPVTDRHEPIKSENKSASVSCSTTILNNDIDCCWMRQMEGGSNVSSHSQ